MKLNNYLVKNILLGFIALVVINILVFKIAGLGKSNFWLWLIFAIPLLWLFKRLMVRTDKFNNGLVGENQVDDVLSQLNKENVCIRNGLDTSRGNIDKIVVGPTGVWSIEVKSHSGVFSFDGNHLLRNGKTMDKDFLKQTYAEAKTLQEIIKTKAGIEISVNPVLVFSNKYAQARFGLKKLNGVYVIRKDWLVKLITEQPQTHLSSEDVSKISQSLTT